MAVTPGYVRLRCSDPSLNIVVLLGPEPVTINAGVGGWAVTARPRQVGMTTWEGVEPFQVTLDLMFDGYAAGRSQETMLSRLLNVARGDDESEPGRLSVEGVLLPADEWVIESVDYGQPIVDPSSRARLRQPVTLTLREFVEPAYLTLRRRALKGAKGKTKVVTAKQGDTPATIARRMKCTFKQIRELNPSLANKANKKLKTGTKLRVPVATKPDKKPTRPSRSRSRR